MQTQERDKRKLLLRTLATVMTVALLAAVPSADARDREINDQNICAAVEDTLFYDKAVPFNRIDVACSDGIVTLKGTTDNLLAKTHAERLAETTKGVRSVINRLDVRPAHDRSAGDIRQDVKSALLADPATESYQVSANANSDGHVTLRGEVDSWQEKQLAAKVAMGVKGVTEITNNIDVDYATDRSDAEIKAEIKKALRWNALVDHSLIDVSVNDGLVSLTGTVGSAAERRQARYDAWVAGVKEVDDSALKTSRWLEGDQRRDQAYVAKPASEIRAAVQDANLYDPRVKAFNIDVDVEGSIATLRGKVDNLKAKRAAAENARNTVGVSRVVNRLKVRPVAALMDKQIEEDIRQALTRDPYVERYDISVDVVDNTAYLSGAVDSYFEKAQAEDAASRVTGVEEVSNALTVTNTNWPVVYDPYVYDWYTYDYGWYDYEPAYTTRTDAEIKDNINDHMWWSPLVDSDEVTVLVDDGVATLTGTVDSWAERRSAAENALEGGATRVENELVVDTG